MKVNRLDSISAGRQRRKILGWLGAGVIGALVLKVLPLRFLSGKSKSIPHSKSTVAINHLAVRRERGKVRRTGRAIKNG